MGKLRPTQVLLTPEQHSELVKLARSEGRSVSALVRETIAKHLDQQATKSTTLERRLEAIEGIRQFREQILRERNDEYIDFDFVEALH